MQLITKKVMLAFVLTFAIVCVIGVVAYWNAQALGRNTRSVAHAYRVMAELSDLFSSVQDAQTSGRGYALTGKEFFLQPYMEAAGDLPQQTKKLRTSVESRPEQLHRVDHLEELIKEEMDFVKETISQRRNSGLEAASRYVATGTGNECMNKIRKLVTEMNDAEVAYEAIQDAQAKKSDALTTFVITISTLLTLVIVAAGSLALHFDIVERERLERGILEISDHEKQSFGRDLHDSLCQELSGISFMAQLVETRLRQANSPDVADVSRIAKLCAESVHHARSLARGLQPVEVESNGLMVALDELAQSVSAMFRTECVFVCKEPVLVPDNKMAVHLYRIVQEAVHNATRHASAKKIEIRMRQFGAKASVEISDNGKGFAVASWKKAGMGLQTMNYRAAAIGGRLTIQPNPTGGTTVQCLFNLNSSPSDAEVKLKAV